MITLALACASEKALLNLVDAYANSSLFAGHPTGKTVDKDVLFVNLQVFVTYCEKIYQLIDSL